MKKFFHLLIATLILLGSYLVVNHLKESAPEAKKHPPKTRKLITVEVTPLKQQNYRIKIKTSGTVKTQMQTTLAAEVSGRITYISPKFRNGLFFNKGDVLFRIDDRNYYTAISVMKAELAQKRLNLKQEQAQAKQAQRDWQRLGEIGKPDALVMHQPQLLAAETNVDAAQARLEQANIDLERTHIIAPYTGRVLEQSADLGQIINSSTPLGVIYATNIVEVRLPLSQKQKDSLQLPRRFQADQQKKSPKVILYAGQQRWSAQLVRTEARIDIESRQQFVIAQVKNPYAKKQSEPLDIGRFVRAEIAGKPLQGIFLVPRTAVRQGNEIQTVVDGKLQRKRLTILWSDEKQLIVDRKNLQTGDLLINTPVNFVADGTSVNIAGEEIQSDTDSSDTKHLGAH